MATARVSFPNLIGHRGAAAHAPENTLASFSKAKDLGASWVELDVQLSADGVPMVFHDDGLERTSNGHGRMCDQPVAVLSKLDAGSWFAPEFAGQVIPTLEAALGHIAGLGLGVNIEIKADEKQGAATALSALSVARAHWPAGLPLPLISSFAESALAAARDAVPIWPRALLVGKVPVNWCKRLEVLDCISLNADWTKLTPAITYDVKQAGYGLLAYTVNNPAQAERLQSWGVDGVFSDDPKRLSERLASSFAE
jgi:glycerophosphoryl diester phosphodiesterase